MRYLLYLLAVIFSTLPALSQPSAATVQSDVKKDLGPNCLAVTVLGKGSTSTDYINGGYSSFYRVSLNVKMKTDMPGVTTLLKGAAVYGYSGGSKYFYKQYAPGTSEYIGLSAPDTAAIRALLLSLPQYGLDQAGHIIDVIGFNFYSSPAPQWHSLKSVSVPADMIYTHKQNSTTIETVKQPYSLRLYRTNSSGPWESVAWTTADYRNDPRLKASLGKETVGEYKMSKITSLQEKAQMKEAEKHAATRPKVDIPKVNNVMDVMKWYHGLLMEGDYAKVEAVTLQLLHPFYFDKNTNLIDANGRSMLLYIQKALTNDYSTYNKQNCINPQISSSSDDEISWWNKDKSKTSTIKIKNENGRWYLYNVAVYVWDFHMESRANAAMSAVCK